MRRERIADSLVVLVGDLWIEIVMGLVRVLWEEFQDKVKLIKMDWNQEFL